MADKLLVEVEELLRNHLIERGWTPPSFEESKKVELEGGRYRFQINGQVFLGEGRYKYGDTRQTEEQAELAAKRMIRVNRLSALAAQLGGEREFVEGENNYLLIRKTNKNEYYWYVDYAQVNNEPEKVYMTQDCAEQICDLLNKGLFSLDGGE